QEFFATRAPTIADARNAAERKKLIAALPEIDPALSTEWCIASRVAQGTSHFLRESRRYPLSGHGDINTYALFVEHNWKIIAGHGRARFIVPSGIVTDERSKELFQALVDSKTLSRVYHFENEERVFRRLHHAHRFILLTIGEADRADFVFYARRAEELDNPALHFTMTAQDIEVLNPNTRTCPT